MARRRRWQTPRKPRRRRLPPDRHPIEASSKETAPPSHEAVALAVQGQRHFTPPSPDPALFDPLRYRAEPASRAYFSPFPHILAAPTTV
eukprot:652038-Hanusia_phi.AAC.1